MTDDNPSIVSHVSIGTNDFTRALQFYDRVLPTLGARPLYGEPYYGCFVRDLDGHKIEAAYWDMELVHKLYIDQ